MLLLLIYAGNPMTASRSYISHNLLAYARTRVQVFQLTKALAPKHVLNKWLTTRDGSSTHFLGRFTNA